VGVVVVVDCWSGVVDTARDVVALVTVIGAAVGRMAVSGTTAVSESSSLSS